MTAEKIQQFSYRGLNEQFVKVVGTVQAESIEMAKYVLWGREISVTKIGEKTKPLFNLTTQKQMQKKDVAVFSRQIATMLKAGLSLVHALEVCSQSTNKAHIRGLLLNLRSEVASGIDLSAALRAYPRLFNELYCDLVAAGEISGNLDAMLDRD